MLQDNKQAIEFVEAMIQKKGLEGLDDEVREQLKKDLLDRLERQINREIINSLSDEQFTQFEVMIENNEVDKIQHFLHNEGVNVSGIVTRTMAEFYTSYLGTPQNG